MRLWPKRRQRPADQLAAIVRDVLAGNGAIPINLRVTVTQGASVRHIVEHAPRPRPMRGRLRVDHPITGLPWTTSFTVMDGRTSIDVPMFDANGMVTRTSAAIEWEY